MEKRNLAVKIVTAVIVGTLLFPPTARAYSPNGAKPHHKASVKHKGFNKPDLQRFVDEKIITQEQAEKIEAFLKKRAEEKKAELEKIKNMSKEERENYIRENYKTRPDIFGDLVSSKIITSEQAQKIKEIISRHHGDILQEVLKNEVSKGTISQEQLDKINEFVKKKKEELKLEKEKIKAMSEAERKAYWQANYKNRTDILTELVNSGIITEQQKEELSKVLPIHPHKNER
ncbi:DUF1682 domain-containing protein [Clostridium thermarum]|uniref:DUF1682 domain-containing protein n=1 Tax=Clostridium thermarum TaxID=1716543 RepID=UPI0013D5696C|nr:DUF1682 domain-containing protein [Clostridium thermarum]